jgi:hypothetical protein
MPSFSHEGLVKLFRDRPELAPELLRDALGVTLPPHSEVRIGEADFTQIVPTDYHADLVVLLVNGKPVLGIVVEIQLRIKARKRFTWPLYAAALRASLECPVCVLVVTTRAKVARWAAKPIDLGPGGRFQPLVLGPEAVPAPANVDAARREPEFAVLAAVAHGNDPDPRSAAEIAATAMVACLDLDSERAALYADLIRASLGPAARAALEALMSSPQYQQFQSEFARKYVGIGEARGKAHSVLAVLDARGIAVSPEQRDRVLACTDVDQLEGWVRRAITAATIEELFA